MVSDNDNIVDTDYTEKKIRGSALYFSTSQVSHTLGESDSKIRYYTNVFDDVLNIEISNKQRRYTQTDIDKMRFLIQLKNDGMTIKQIQEYCQEVDFQEKGIQVKESNPLSIQAMSKALLEEQGKQMEVFKEDLVKQLKEHMQMQISMMDRNNENIKEQIAITVDDILSEKMEDFKNDFTAKMQEANEIRQKELEMNQYLRNKLESKKEEYEKSNSFFNRIFKKK